MSRKRERLLNQPRKKTNKNIALANASIEQNLLQKSLPESMEAEAAVLGCMILDGQCIGEVIQSISMEAFYRLEHQTIFDGLVSLYENGNALDLILLRDKLKSINKLEEVGGIDYLTRVVNSVPTTANIMYYVNIVKDKYIMRQLITAASDILNQAYDNTGETKEKLDEAERKVFEVTQQKLTGDVSNFRSLMHHAIEMVEHPAHGLPVGFHELNEMLCGFHGGELIIIAGRPSMGKTSFAVNIAEYMAVTENLPIAIFSLEMGSLQLAQRILCSIACVDLQSLRTGNLEDGAYDELVRAGSELSEKPIYIDDSSALTPLELKAKARRLKSQYDIKCIFVDYLQLMSMGGRAESRQQEITTISRHMKALARELDLPVVVLSQLNRAAEQREGHRPRMSDLRESGSIEQDADVIMLLHREDYYHRGEPDWNDQGKAEVIVAKQRNGPTGVVELTFVDRYARFSDPSFSTEPI